MVGAAEALAMGLVTEVVAPGATLARALELAEELAALPAGDAARRPPRRARGLGLPLAEGLALEARLGRTLADAAPGAARFAAGEGRGGAGGLGGRR